MMDPRVRPNPWISGKCPDNALREGGKCNMIGELDPCKWCCIGCGFLDECPKKCASLEEAHHHA